MRRSAGSKRSFIHGRVLISSVLCVIGFFLALLGWGAMEQNIQSFGGGDINLITGAETHPRITQSSSAVWGNGTTVVVAIEDSSGSGLNPISICGVSTSTDGGNTFTRLPEKFNNGGACYGYPAIVYSVRAAKWFASFLAERCGGSGVGMWTSADGINWINAACVVSSSVDVFSTWIDNNAASPFYGNIYATFNDFNIDAHPRVTRSTDNGATWSSAVKLFAGFRRTWKVTGSLGSDGTVYVQTLDEGGGGLANPRQNFIQRSTDGGLTWNAPVSQGAPFSGPGRSVSSYFAGMYATPVAGYWREMGWGETAVGPSGVVHHAYSAAGTSPDPGNILYVRSTDFGTTWSAPLKLNSDTTTRAQWSPSLSANIQGKVFVSWYDERNTTTDSLERYGRASTDNGLTWGPDMPLSNVIFPKPLQPDPVVQTTWVGVFHRSAFSNNGTGDTAYHTWTDGRVEINGAPQQDVYFHKALGPTPPNALGNISTRGFVGTGNNVLIGGLIISGAGPKKVILRALGPTLGQPPFNVPNALANPMLELRDGGGALITSNNNWIDAANKQAIIDTGLAPPNNLESAILTSLNPGQYTAVVRGVNNGTGIALVDAYDLDLTSGSNFGNISTRGFVGTGADVMIAGMVVYGPTGEDVIVRGLGPTLTQFGVPGVLADTILDLRDGNGNLLMTNDNWKDTQQAQIQASGHAPPNNQESAIAATLNAGNYTAILRGKNNTTGNALVEVYGLN